MQVEPLSKNSNNSKYKSIYQSVCVISKEEGFKALWKGHLPGQYLSITYGLTQVIIIYTIIVHVIVLNCHKYVYVNNQWLSYSRSLTQLMPYNWGWWFLWLYTHDSWFPLTKKLFKLGNKWS